MRRRSSSEDGETTAFKTSTGAEVRFFMPVLNVPFRLIFAYNPQRFPVLDNSLRPAKIHVQVRRGVDFLTCRPQKARMAQRNS